MKLVNGFNKHEKKTTRPWQVFVTSGMVTLSKVVGDLQLGDKKVRAWISWSKLLTHPKFNRKRPWKVKKGSSNHHFSGTFPVKLGVQFTSPRHLRARFRRWLWDGGYRFRDRWNEDLKNSTNTASAKGTPQRHEGRSSWGISTIIEGLPCIGTWYIYIYLFLSR